MSIKNSFARLVVSGSFASVFASLGTVGVATFTTFIGPRAAMYVAAACSVLAALSPSLQQVLLDLWPSLRKDAQEGQ